MEKLCKTKIRVQPVYSIITWLVMSLIFITLLVLPHFVWEQPQGAWGILYYVLFSICLIGCLIGFFHHLQFAVVNKERLVIRGIFRIIASIAWSEIYKIIEDSIATLESRGTPVVYYNWLVILITPKDEAQYRKGGRNKKNKSPWQIIATSKNKQIIENNYYIVTGKRIEVTKSIKRKKNKQ